jgi:hypothetical protein
MPAPRRKPRPSRKPDGAHDTGLRFEMLTDGRWLCPACCAKVVEPEFEPPPGFWDYPNK